MIFINVKTLMKKLKNILAENMRRFGTKNLQEAGNDEDANKKLADFLKSEYYDGAPDTNKVSALSIANNYYMDFEGRLNPRFIQHIFKTYLNIDLSYRPG